MFPKNKFYWLIILIPLALVLWFYFSQKKNQPSHFLPYFSKKNALKLNDTTYHFIPNFEFTNQFNEKINSKYVKNKIYVTEYFFTTCQTICPIMNENLKLVYKEFINNKDVLILSHTVDPINDNVQALSIYAKKHGVTDKKWLFLTGSKKDLYQLARKGYLLNAEKGNGDDNDFIHTQNFALIDKEGHIRGFYDGTDQAEIIRLIQEIKLLIAEYDYKNSKNNS